MSSKLQSDGCQWWRRLVNAYELKAGMVCLQCNNCVIHLPEHFRGEFFMKGCYTNINTFTFLSLYLFWDIARYLSKIVYFYIPFVFITAQSVKVSMTVSMKISRLLDTTRENSARWYIKKSIPVYLKFRYFRYDTIRYIGIESIFSIYRSITILR